MGPQALKAALKKERAKARQISDACINQAGEFRNMTPEEKQLFNAAMANIVAMQEQLESLAAMGDEDDEEDEERSAPIPAPRQSRGRVSDPIDQRSAPAVHTAERSYSILRAMRLDLEGKRVDGLEGEASQEIAKRAGKDPAGFYLPMGNEPELRGLKGIRMEQRGDLTTTTGTGAVFTSPMLPFIELLRNKIVLKQMGATFLTGMDGKFSIPRQNGAASSAWIAEGSSLTPNNQTLDQVAFVNKTLGAATNISRKFIYQTSVDAEAFVQNDLAQVLAIGFDYAGINGSGSGAVPIGIVQNSTIQTNSAGVQGGTNGLAMTFAQLVKMETQVTNANADRGKLAYLTCPGVRGNLKTTAKIGTTFPVFLWEDGEVNGYPAWATNQVPNNLTKGTGTGLGAMIFGNFEDVVLAQWGGIDVVVNPYTGQLSGAITISMMTEADVEIRHPESFSVVSDVVIS